MVSQGQSQGQQEVKVKMVANNHQENDPLSPMITINFHVMK